MTYDVPHAFHVCLDEKVEDLPVDGNDGRSVRGVVLSKVHSRRAYKVSSAHVARASELKLPTLRLVVRVRILDEPEA